MSLAHPWSLLLLPAVWALLLIGSWRARGGASLRYSSMALVEHAPRGWRGRTRWIPLALRLAGAALLVVALARPRVANTHQVVEGEGVDIAMVLDISGSMRALDFQPDDRITVAKRVLTDFIDGRSHDRISLVVFAARAFTQCPLTLDYDVLKRFLAEVHVGLIEDGTAIGLGIATGVKRLARSNAKSKVLVLITDGVNNVPTVDPRTAAEAAKSLGVKIYAVGVGKEGLAPYPIDHPVLGPRTTTIETHIDEALLRDIAKSTGGQYFRAQDSESLQRIFQVIDQLEKTKLQTTIFTNYRELATWFLLPGILLLALDALLAATLYRVLP